MSVLKASLRYVWELVKEMRLCGIDTIAAGNAFLPAFIDDYNGARGRCSARAGRRRRRGRDAHR
jgi:hypothetical protein